MTTDSGISIETLLSQREWVRKMARALVWGDQQAEDLEQEAWLASLETPPRDDVSPRGWLATVLRRTAGRLGRRDLRRQEIDIGRGPGGASPAAADVVAAAELQEKVVRLALALAEPYRQTILLRFFEGLSIREIARRVDAPPETVRTRLRRGLGTLRSQLESKDPEGWRRALLPLAAAPAAKTVTVLAGALALAATVVVTVFFVMKPGADPRPQDTAPSARERSPEVAAIPSRTAETPRINPAPFVEPREPTETETRPAAPTTAHLEVQILDASGAPVVGHKFDLVVVLGAKTARQIADEAPFLDRVYGQSDENIISRDLRATTVEARTGPDGFVRREVEAGAPGRLRVCPTPADWRGQRVDEKIEFLGPFEFEPVAQGATRRLPPITLPSKPLLVAGRVETPAGKPLADALVHALLMGENATNDALIRISHRLVTRTDAQGRFRIESPVRGRFFAWAHTDRQTSFFAWAHTDKNASAPLVAFEAGTDDLVLRMVQFGGIRGRVRSANGDQPEVALAPEGFPDFHVPYSWSHRFPTDIDVAPTGEFESSKLVPGRYTLQVTLGIARVLTIEGIEIRAGVVNADARFADVLVGEGFGPGLVTVVDVEGRPVSGARVVFFGAAAESRVTASNTTHTDESGEATTSLPADASMDIKVEHSHFLPESRSSVRLPLRVTLERGAEVTVHLADAASLPNAEGVHGWWICLIPEADADEAAKAKRAPIPKALPASQTEAVYGEHPKVELTGTRPGRYVVFLFPYPNAMFTGSDFEWDLGGGEAVELGRMDVRRDVKNEATFRVQPARILEILPK
jgi:RNA polymerase sigma factor (sigma-70 family)